MGKIPRKKAAIWLPELIINQVRSSICCLLCCFSFFAIGQSQDGPEFLWDADGHPAYLVINNWGIGMEDLHSLDLNVAREYLKVYKGELTKEELKGRQAILGKYRLKGHQLLFQPIIPFEPGQRYTAFWGDLFCSRYQVPKHKKGSPTQLTAIFPSTDTLPANLLKMYLYFSEAMSEGNVYQYINVTTQKGDTIPLPFLPLTPELWDEDHRRLTLWLDPGRVKRDLIPNQLLGPPLLEQTQYVLHISRKWPDQEGFPLATNYSKTFWVRADDRIKPVVDHWQLDLPIKGTLSPLTIHFGESIDEVLSTRCIQVFDKNNQSIGGKSRLQEQESQWVFFPDESWQAGQFIIRIESRLEDLAGNNLNRLFDVDNQNANQKPSNQVYFWLYFEI